MGLLLSSGIVAFSVLLPIIYLFWVLRRKAESRAFFFSIVLVVAVYLFVDWSVVGFWNVVGTFGHRCS